MKQLHFGKLSTWDTMSLFIHEKCCGFPKNVIHAPDMLTRWYIIGKKRFEKEQNLVKLMKTIKNLKIMMDPTKYQKAQCIFHAKNVIEVDSDDIIRNQMGENFKGMMTGNFLRNLNTPGEYDDAKSQVNLDVHS